MCLARVQLINYYTNDDEISCGKRVISYYAIDETKTMAALVRKWKTMSWYAIFRKEYYELVRDN